MPRPLPVFEQAAPSATRGTFGQGSQKVQLLLLHSAFPHADKDAELFALRGNFTPEAAAIAVKVRPNLGVDSRVALPLWSHYGPSKLPGLGGGVLMPCMAVLE